MRKTRTFNPTWLTLDVLDYMFVEWLVRQDLYVKFAANLTYPGSRSSRLIIRDLVREVLSTPDYSPSDLVSSSFSFRCTPEGFHFWARVSSDWASYLKSFSKII